MKPAVKKFILSTILALATLSATSLFWNEPVTATIVLIGLSLLMFSVEPGIGNMVLYFFGFVFGPIAEAIAIHFGAWNYTLPVIAGIPLWLPFVWGNCGLYVIRVKAFISTLPSTD